MSYNFVYCLYDSDSGDRRFFSTESIAFQYADKMGYKSFTVECVRYYYELD